MNRTGPKLSLSKQQIWVCVVAGLFVSDFIWCGYLPAQERLKSLKQAWAQQQRIVMMGATQGAELPALTQRLQDTEDIVALYDVRVPPEGTLGTFLQRMAGIMTGRRLTNQEVVPGKAWETDGLTCIPVQVTCAGTLADVFNFFNDLQALNRLVRIERVALGNDSGMTGRIHMRMEGVIFHQTPRQSKASDSAHAELAGGTNNGA
jgi:Tfp pilus assembly protein PilO